MDAILITIIALGICAAICFRIAWEEYCWPSTPNDEATDEPLIHSSTPNDE